MTSQNFSNWLKNSGVALSLGMALFSIASVCSVTFYQVQELRKLQTEMQVDLKIVKDQLLDIKVNQAVQANQIESIKEVLKK